MSEQQTISVNFARPMPVFPLATASMLPQQVLPLHIFEPRYRQMLDHVLDGAGQIAIAVFQGDRWKSEYHGNPPIRPYVCVGQLVQHERLPDGRYNILLHGICRARVIREIPPDENHQYRRALLEPVGTNPDEQPLDAVRHRLRSALSSGPLKQMTACEPVLQYLDNEEVPTSAVLELVSFTMLGDPDTRYRLLAEPDATRRAQIVEHELARLSDLIERARRQHPEAWPKGCSWN